MARIQTWQWRLPPGLSQRWLPLLAAAPLLCLFLLEGGAIVDTLRYRPPLAGGTAQPAPVPGEVAGRIAAAHWFGVADAEAVAATALPETRLALTLRAVFVGANRSSAIIETDDGVAQVVRAGATITPGITLTEVHSDRVIVSRNGRQEQLFFPTETATTALAELPATNSAQIPAAASGQLTDEQKRANILRRLEALRARGAG